MQIIYNNPDFFQKYSQMSRSVKGLEGAGEWQSLEKMLPNFSGLNVLDLGCGFGWHCQYAFEHDAKSIIGVDVSQRMLDVALKNTSHKIKYLCQSIDDLNFSESSFDAVISSLALHYLESVSEIFRNVYSWLSSGGTFVFSVEHPTFSAYGTQDWYRNTDGEILHFPVDRYFDEGKRESIFLGTQVLKYHRTLTTYLSSLLSSGFEITGVVEPQPPQHLLESVSGMKNELRRPMMLLVSARKP